VAINQLVLNLESNLLLVSADPPSVNLELVYRVTNIASTPISEVPDFWISHPTLVIKCISFRTTTIAIVDWNMTRESVSLDTTIMLDLNTAPDEKVKSTIECGNGLKIAVEIPKQERGGSTTKLLIFDSAKIRRPLALEGDDTSGDLLEAQFLIPPPEFLPLGPHIEYLIVAFSNKLVFLNRDLWVCSADLERRTVFSGRDTDAASVDSEPRRQSRSQRISSINSSSSLQPRVREPSVNELSLDRRLSLNPLSRAAMIENSPSRTSSTSRQNPSILSRSGPSSPLPLTCYSRHFFVPTPWHNALSSSSGQNLTIRISSRCDVTFVRDEECSVAQQGLDFEELVSLPE
jgi:hypothetical protein